MSVRPEPSSPTLPYVTNSSLTKPASPVLSSPPVCSSCCYGDSAFFKDTSQPSPNPEKDFLSVSLHKHVYTNNHTRYTVHTHTHFTQKEMFKAKIHEKLYCIVKYFSHAVSANRVMLSNKLALSHICYCCLHSGLRICFTHKRRKQLSCYLTFMSVVSRLSKKLGEQ